MKPIKEVSNAARSESNAVGERLQHLGDDARDFAETAGRRARQAGEVAERLYREKRAELGEMTSELSANVRQRPIQAIALASLAGYILGRLFSR